MRPTFLRNESGSVAAAVVDVVVVVASTTSTRWIRVAEQVRRSHGEARRWPRSGRGCSRRCLARDQVGRKSVQTEMKIPLLVFGAKSSVTQHHSSFSQSLFDAIYVSTYAIKT